MMNRPLDGVSIVEAYASDSPLVLRLAGALAGRIGADLGARVVKLEQAGGDPVRRIAPLVGETSTIFAFLNAGKTVEFGEAAALSLILRHADVAIVDAGLQRALAEAPRILAVLSLFRPGAQPFPASEFTLMALGGLLDIVGDPDREPLKLGAHQAACP